MNKAHERAAGRLAGLSAGERDWILARLTPVDAVRIRELMDRGPAPAQPEAAPEASAGNEPRAARVPAQSRVARASPAAVSQALRDEPDWLVALVLAQRWPWDREVLSGLEPARLEALGALTRKAQETAKPAARDAAVAALAAKLDELAPAPQARSAFDDVLDGMTAGAEAPQGRQA